MLLAELQSKITEDGKIECRQCKSHKASFEPYLEYTKLGGDPILYRYCSNCRASAKPCAGSKHEVDYQAYPHMKAYVLSVAGVPKISESQKGPEAMNFFQMQIDKMIVDTQSKGYNPSGIISIPEKNLLIACSKDGRVTVWSLGDEVEPVVDFSTGNSIKCVKYFVTPSGESFLAIGAGNGIQIYEFEENKPELKRTLDHTADVKCFEYVANESSGEGKLVSVSADNILREWDIASPRCCSDRNLKEHNINEAPSRIAYLKEKGLLALNCTNEIILIKLDEKSFSKKISCPESGISMCYLPNRNKIIVRADRRSFAQLDIANNFKRNLPKGSLMFEPYVSETTYIANQDESQVISNDIKDFLVISDFTKETLSKSFGHFLAKISAIVPIPSQNRLIIGDDTSGAILILRTNIESTPKAKRAHSVTKSVGKASESKSVSGEIQKPYQSSLFSNKPTQTGTEKLFQNQESLKSQDSLVEEKEAESKPAVQIENTGAEVETGELSKNLETEEKPQEPQRPQRSALLEENKPVQIETETVTEIEIETGTGGVLQLSETTLNAEPLKPEEAQIETETPGGESAEIIQEPAKPENVEKIDLVKEPAKPQGSLFSNLPADTLFKKEPAKPQSSLFANKPSGTGTVTGGLFRNLKPNNTSLFQSSGNKIGENGLFAKLESSPSARLFLNNTNNVLGGGLFSSGSGTGGGLFSGNKPSGGLFSGSSAGTGGGLFAGSGGGLFGNPNRYTGKPSLFFSGPSLFSKPATGGVFSGSGTQTGGLFSSNRTGGSGSSLVSKPAVGVAGGLFGNSRRSGGSVGKKLPASKASGSTAKKTSTRASASRKTAKSSLNKRALASASKKKVEKVKAKTSRPAKPTSKNQEVKEAKSRAVKAVAKKETPKKKNVKAEKEEDRNEKSSTGALKFTRIRDDLKISKRNKKKEEKEEPVWVMLPEDETEEEEGVQKEKRGGNKSPKAEKGKKEKQKSEEKEKERSRGRSKSPKAEKGRKEKQKSEEKEKDRSRSRSKSQDVSSKKSIHETIKGAKELVKGIRKKMNAKKKQEK